MSESALSHLKPDEVCTVVMQDGTRRDGAWEPEEKRFRFCDGLGSGYAELGEVYEWWPAGVKF